MACTITKVLDKHCNDGRLSHTDSPPVLDMSYNMDEVLAVRWRELVQDENAFLSPDYLRSIEQANGKELELRYVIFSKDNKAVGVSAFQITHFATSADAYSNPVMCFLHSTVQYLKLGHIHNILICGNAIATGEHGFFFHPSVSTESAARMLVMAMNKIAAEEKTKRKRICAMVVKDFYPDSSEFPKGFEQCGFKAFNIDHNMVMPLLPEWKSFDDYLLALITKFRTKAKSALTKSSALKVESLTSETITPHLPMLQKLYENVHYKADFRLGKMNVNALPLLLERMPDDFFVTIYSLDDEVVGFKTAMRCGNSLEAHIVGINYECNKQYAIYQRILYDYVVLGIKLRCTKIVLGRTAAEIKSTIGALPVDLTCAILHQRTISNALLKMIIRYVGPSSYEQRQPYKAEVYKEIKAV